MLLAFDIGNTNIKIALAEGEKILHKWRISTDAKRTGDEYFSILRPLLKEANIDASMISQAVISSVVPSLIGAFVIVTRHLLNKKPLIIGPEMYNCLPVKIPQSAVHEIGTDLLCDALAAWTKFNQPCIIVDFGTALSFTAVDSNANIAGIAICPGIGTALKSLFTNTAQLPSVSLEIPPSSLGKNTIWSVQSGIVLGYKGLVEGLIQRMKDDLHKECSIKKETIKVIGTGGLNSMLAPITDSFDYMDKELTIFGLVKTVEYYQTSKK